MSHTAHANKCLAIQFSRGSIWETHYFYSIPTIHDVLNAFDVEESDMGFDSLAWLELVMLPNLARDYGTPNDIPCAWETANGDWKLYSLCD